MTDPSGFGQDWWTMKVQDYAVRYALAARAERDALYETKVATLEQQRNLLMGKAGWLAQLVIDKLGGTPDLDEWIRRSAKYYQETIDRAETAEARVKELEARIAVLGDSGLTAAWREIDALRAWLEAIEKQPTRGIRANDGPGFSELIERPNMDRNADSPTATAEGQRASEGEIGPPR